MNKFPLPPPDRRLQKKLSYPKLLEIDKSKNTIIEDENNTNQIKFNSASNFHKTISYSNFKKDSTQINNILLSDINDKQDNNLNKIKIKHVEEMRNNILTHKLLSDKQMFLSGINNSNNIINKCNIILFGPSGSGKSSFIKTLYRALYSTQFLPPDAVSKLIIKQEDQNEGTLCFTRLHLKEEANNSSGVVICDTRGHIWMNEAEKEQFKVLLKGNIKDGIELKQNKSRSPFLLWEFWKKDSELFPKDIFYAQEIGIDSIPHNVVLVFDGSNDDIIDPDEEKFYKDLVEISFSKGNT